MKKFVLKKGVRFLGRDGSTALLMNFGRRQMLKGPVVDEKFERCLAALLTPIDLETLESQLGGDKDTAEEILRQLGHWNLIETLDADETARFETGDPLLYFLSQFRHGAKSSVAALEKFAAQKIHLIDHVGLGDYLRPVFKSTKIVESDQTAADFVVVVSSWLHEDQLCKIGRELYAAKKPWLLVTADYFGGSIGPYFAPGESPCFECLASRRRSHLTHYQRQKQMGGEDPPPFPLYGEILSRFIAAELFKTMARSNPGPLANGLVELDFLNHRSSFYEIFPTPYCQVCSDVESVPFYSGEPAQ